MNSSKLGRYSFIAGLVLAAILGLFSADWAYWLLAVLGLVVGFLNISDSESHPFLVAAIALIITSASLSGLPLVGGLVTNLLNAVVVFVSAATVVVAVKSLFEAAQN